LSQQRLDTEIQAYALQAGGYAAAAATSAGIAENYATSLTSTSTSSILISVGVLTFVTQAAKLYTPGQFVVISEISNPTENWLYGQVSSYSGTNLVVNVTSINGIGTYADWNISMCGVQGQTGEVPVISSTSVTSMTIGLGSQSFTTSAGLSFSVNQFALISSTASPLNWMTGNITSYNSSTGSMIVNVTYIGGSGTFADWTVSLSGAPGASTTDISTALTEIVESTGYGIISGGAVTAQSTPNMTVSVAASIAHMPSGARFTPAAVSALAINAADTVLPRIDLIYLAAANGAITYLPGISAATPVAPTLPSGGLGEATVLVPANSTAIPQANITDIRILKVNSQTTANAVSAVVPLKALSNNFVRSLFWDCDVDVYTNYSYCNRKIPFLGDSHGWGEGGCGYQGASAGVSVHAEWPQNKGFYGRLRDYFYKKYDSKPWRCVPLGNGNETQATATVQTGALVNNWQQKYEDEILFTNVPRFISGNYRIYPQTKSAMSGYNTTMNSWLNAEAQEDTYSQAQYRHNADIGLFTKWQMELAPATGASGVLMDLKTPTRYIFIAALMGPDQGVMNLELLDDVLDITTQAVSTWGDTNFGTAVPLVNYMDVNNNPQVVSSPTATVNATNILIDMHNGVGYSYTVFMIDLGQKKQGTIRMSCGTPNSSATSNATFGCPIITCRGIIIGNNDVIKNWSCGGHTTGAMLGLEMSFSGENHNHVADIKTYMEGNLGGSYGNIQGIILQAPIVNEYLRQNPVATMTTNLTSIATALGQGNMLVFTTIGQMNMEFVTDTGAITYQNYFDALRLWCVNSAVEVTYVDCRSYLKQLVANGIVRYQDLYYNNEHPSSMANEIIFGMLKQAVDLKF
jgi:hypothetical protein